LVTNMFTQLVQQLTRFLPPGAARALAAPQADDERSGSGWHESSWMLAHGADVIELPAPVAATWFPDTQPACHDASPEWR
jgi:hypothetical protein